MIRRYEKKKLDRSMGVKNRLIVNSFSSETILFSSDFFGSLALQLVRDFEASLDFQLLFIAKRFWFSGHSGGGSTGFLVRGFR